MTTVIAPLQNAFWQACETLLYRHTTPWELDEALVEWGYGLGPCEAQDLVGLNKVLAARDGADVTPVLPRMVAEGRLGKRFGWGFYRYPGGGGAVIDPLIEDLICEEAWFAKVERSELSGAELVARLHADVGDVLRANPDAAVTQLHFPADRFATI
ncbi:3-hydroxyacyl-CoA dehydrogenase family protein [Tateyamaria sp. syn59]|uniref:3-hydroxyacyl-CoA dehydrogenase family protein n=1 Tax=Tateyamaria sp. syn59 TaxID=2576942 RepID=UPI0011BDD24A|nr:3-hydroxyacyl-CoA dehydrogenase family protein [Tateyamaria sp. syn59]